MQTDRRVRKHARQPWSVCAATPVFVLALFYLEICYECSVADVGFHELQLAMRQHKQWLEDEDSELLNSSHMLAQQLSGRKILGRYLHGMRQLRDSIASQLVTYDIHAMVVSAIILWIVSLSMLNFLLL